MELYKKIWKKEKLTNFLKLGQKMPHKPLEIGLYPFYDVSQFQSLFIYNGNYFVLPFSPHLNYYFVVIFSQISKNSTPSLEPISKKLLSLAMFLMVSSFK